jgi:hypothetical protein
MERERESKRAGSLDERERERVSVKFCYLTVEINVN